jgi:molybdenum cofactor biosynthesis enzyme MoaA
VILTGGEPLMRDDIFEIINTTAMKKAFVRSSLKTVPSLQMKKRKDLKMAGSSG